MLLYSSVYSKNHTNLFSNSGIRSVINPDIDIEKVVQFCEGNTAVVTPKNNDPSQQITYEWFQNGTKIHEGDVFSTTKAGTFVLRATNQFGDFTDYEFTTVTNANPVIWAEQTFFDVCPSKSQTLEVKTNNAIRFEWFKNNKKIDNETAAILTTLENGDYKVIGYSEQGCKSNEIVFTINQLPIPSNIIKVKNQSLSNDSIYHICKGETVIAAVASNARIIHWFKKGEKTILSDTSEVVITESGTYTAIATSEAGCTHTQEITVQVHELPKINIIGNLEICNGNSNTLTAQMSNSDEKLHYRWYKKIGSNYEVLDQNTQSISVNDDATYKVIVLNSQGCSAQAEYTTIINPTPTAAFTQESEFIYDNAEVVFNEKVNYAGDKNELTYVWDFGDGTSSNEQNPTHHYPPNAPGESINYTVKLTVTSSKGCSHFTTSQILVHNSERPIGRSRAVLPRCGGKDVQFFDNSVPARQGGAVTAWLWDFGDGTTSQEKDPVHTFKNDGVHHITLRTTDEYNGISPITTLSVITIYLNPTPIANFEAAARTCLNQPFIVQSTSKINFGFITKWIWDFGDGTIVVNSNASAVSHTFKTPGKKTVKLRVETPQICFSEISKEFIIDPLPEVDFNIPDTVCMNENFPINQIKNDNTVRWIWEMNDGSPAIVKTHNTDFTYKFTKTGLKRITLKAVNQLGCINIIEKNIFVKAIAISNFKVSSQTVCLGQSVRVDEIAHAGIISWTWETSEGLLKQQNNTAFDYTFKTIGTHFIRLKVINTLGCPDEFEIPIVVTAIPKAQFDIENKFWMVNDTVVLNDEATVEDNNWSLINYTWTMGDGSQISGKSSPKYVYSKSGNYTVQLLTNNRQGCGTAFEKNVTIYDYPQAQFVTDKTDICTDGTLILTNQSTVGNNVATKLEWYFNYDKNSKPDLVINQPNIGQIFQHRYQFNYEKEVTIKVRLVIYTQTGHSSSVEKEITVHPLPKLQFTPLHDLCLLGGSYQIIEAKELLGLKGKGIFSGKGVSEDGIIDPTKMGIGTHEITYTFVSEFDCMRQIRQTVNIIPSPIVSTPKFIDIFENDTFQIHPTYSGNIISYNWYPTTGVSDPFSPNPTITLSEDESLQITVVNDVGCTYTSTIPITVYKEIQAPNAFSPNGDGINDVWNVPNLKKYKTKAKLQIFNRQGQLVHEQIGYDSPWDGRSKGQILPVGVYFYKIDKVFGNKAFTGTITIIK